MITDDEIKAKSLELDVHTSDVQRDYVFGWLLSGIRNASPQLSESLILKGGNAFRKAYFTDARYSNDLDFSVEDEVEPDKMQAQLNEVCTYVSDHTGINFSLDETRIGLKRGADTDAKVFEARVYFQGFYGEEHFNLKAKVDLTEFDRIFLPIQPRRVIHDYSDQELCTGEIRCHKLEELLAAKLKALLLRIHSPDLFDFIYCVFFQTDLGINRLEVITTFLKKTIYEGDPGIAKALLLGLPFQTFRAVWDKYLVLPKVSIISFVDAESQFRSIIEQLFSLLEPAQQGTAGGIFRSRYLSHFPSTRRNLIMEAGRTQTLLRMRYDGLERLVEPYAIKYKIRQDGVGREYFYGVDIKGGRSGVVGIKMYTEDKVQGMELTEQKFDPRYPIEVVKTDDSLSYFGQSFSSGSRSTSGCVTSRSKPRSIFGLTYTVKCTACDKTFTRQSFDMKLNKHKDRHGNLCYGTLGYLV